MSHNLKGVLATISDLVSQANRSVDPEDSTTKETLDQILNYVNFGKKIVSASLAQQELLTQNEIAIFKDRHAALLAKLSSIEESNVVSLN